MMSQTFSIICEETKERLWIGQGWGELTTFYSGDSDVMENLHEFLNKNMYNTLRVVNDDCDEYYDYRTFKK